MITKSCFLLQSRSWYQGTTGQVLANIFAASKNSPYQPSNCQLITAFKCLLWKTSQSLLWVIHHRSIIYRIVHFHLNHEGKIFYETSKKYPKFTILYITLYTLCILDQYSAIGLRLFKEILNISQVIVIIMIKMMIMMIKIIMLIMMMRMMIMMYRWKWWKWWKWW